MQSRTVLRPLAPVIAVTVALLLAGLTFLIPVASGVDDPLSAHLRTAVATVTAALFVGASVIFLQALKNFKSDLRVAYRLFASGMILFGVSLWQLPILGLFDQWNSAFVTSGGVLIPFLLCMVVSYVGMRRFARLLQIRSIVASVWFAIVISTLFAITSYFAAREGLRYSEEGADVYIAVAGWATIFMVFTAILIHKIRHTIGQSYRRAMGWLEGGLIAMTIAGAHEYSTSFVVHNGEPFVDTGLYLWPFAVTGLLIVWGSYRFRLLGAGAENAEETPADKPKQATDHDYIDSIIAVSELASRPTEIDSIMDDLRIVTAEVKPGESLSTAQKQRLMLTFLALESYLTTRDPLRNFTKDEVRNHTTPAFRAVL
jgi:hypothetical protein